MLMSIKNDYRRRPSNMFLISWSRSNENIRIFIVSFRCTHRFQCTFTLRDEIRMFWSCIALFDQCTLYIGLFSSLETLDPRTHVVAKYGMNVTLHNIHKFPTSKYNLNCTIHAYQNHQYFTNLPVIYWPIK